MADQYIVNQASIKRITIILRGAPNRFTLGINQSDLKRRAVEWLDQDDEIIKVVKLGGWSLDF